MITDLSKEVVHKSKEAVNNIRKIKKQVTQQQENLIELFNLIKEHPDLPIIPMVDSEIVQEDSCCYWTGIWGNCLIDKYITSKDYGILFYENGKPDIVDIFEKYFDYNECGITSDTSDEETEKIMQEKVNSLDWKEAIFVYITAE